MNSLFKKISHIVPASITLIAFLLLRMCKLSPILGSHFSFFSLTDVLMPLTGAVGISLGLVAVMIRILFRASFVSLSVFELVRFAPGLCASYYWATNSKLVRLYLPLLCMALFIVHPVGYYAAPYALYWLIPVALYFQNKKNIFFESLGSTFIAHAVGSVIWLYTFQMSAAMWLALIPVVAVERLLFASTMTLVYSVCSFIKSELYTRAYSLKNYIG